MIRGVGMRRRFWRLIAAALFVFGAGLPMTRGNGEPLAKSETPQLITLKTAIETALESNLDLMLAGSLVDSREISVRRNQGDFLPDLRLFMGAGESYAKRYDSFADRYEGATSKSMNLQLSSSMDLFTGFGKIASLERAGLQLRAERSNLSRSREEIIFQTIQQYIVVAVDKELITADESYLEGQRKLLDQVDAFVNAGARAIVDLYQQQSAVADAEGRILLARRDYEVDKLGLLLVMGFDPRADVTIGALDVDALTAELAVEGPDTSVGRALITRADLVASRYQEQAAKKQITASRSGYWPNLSLSANTGTSYRDPTSPGASFVDQFSKNNVNSSVNVSFSFPIFDRLATITSVADARVGLRQAELNREKLERQVTIDVRQALQDYAIARKSVEVAQAAFDYSQEALMSMDERYRAGVSTLVELSLAQATMLQSSYNLINARYNLILRSIGVSFYAGSIERILPLIR
jgi:outer membrane protein